MKTKYAYTFTTFTDRDYYDDVAVGTIDDIAKVEHLRRVYRITDCGKLETLRTKTIRSDGKPDIFVLVDACNEIVETTY